MTTANDDAIAQNDIARWGTEIISRASMIADDERVSVQDRIDELKSALESAESSLNELVERRHEDNLKG